MPSLCLHFKELQPIYAYKGYAYIKKSTKNKEKNSDFSFQNLPTFFANFHSVWYRLSLNRHQQPNYDHTNNTLTAMPKTHICIPKKSVWLSDAAPFI